MKMVVQVSMTDEDTGVSGSYGQTYKDVDIAAAMADLPVTIVSLSKALGEEAKTSTPVPRAVDIPRCVGCRYSPAINYSYCVTCMQGGWSRFKAR